MAAGANDLTSALHLARTEAVKRRANVTICPSADAMANAPTCDNNGSFADGWIVFVDCTVPPPSQLGICGAPNYVVDNFDTVVGAHGALIDNLANNFQSFAAGAGANTTPAYVTFAPTGFPRTIPALAGTPAVTEIQLCDERGNDDVGGGIAAGRWINISPTGRPQIYRNVADIQGGLNPLGGC